MTKESAGQVSVGDVIQETRFFDVSLEDAGVPYFDESIEIAEFLRSELKQLQMLVLGGHKLEDKAMFGLHVAWHLRAELGLSIPVKQWHPGLAPSNFDEALRQFKKCSILLFPSVFPHDFGHDLRHLYSEVCEHGHFAIVSTNSALRDWGGLELLEKRLWKEPDTADVYPLEHLARLLKKELKDTSGCWSDKLLEQWAANLRTPSRTRTFARLVSREKGSVDAAWIEELLEQLNGNGHAVGRWYRQLGQRHQSVALGLALLEGVSRDQALAAMEVVTTQVWRPREPQFQPPDACDLPPLGAHFGGIGQDATDSIVSCHLPENRRAILRAAWDCHERQVLAILPVLARIASDSGRFGSGPMEFRPVDETQGSSQTTELEEKGEDSKTSRISSWLPHGLIRDLFGSPARVQQVQAAVSSSLSEIGRFSFCAVENLLLQLAASQEQAARSVAAAALARWRVPEDNNPELRLKYEDKLFDTLERWWSEAFDLEIETLVGLRTTDQLAWIRSTVAMTISFAALFDQRNHLAPRLQALFEVSAKDSRDIVRASFRNHTLPWITALHLSQVEHFLSDTIALEIESLPGLAVGVAAAARIQPREAFPILERWYEEGLAAKTPRKGKIPPAKKRLAVAVLAYGCIAASNLAPRDCPRAEALGRIRRVYAEEKTLRWVIVEAMKVQIWQDLEGTEALLQDLLGDLTRQDRSSVVPHLVALHAKERETLPGSDMRCVFLGQQSHKAWTNPVSKRPLTRVEIVLKSWLLEGTFRAGVRIATRTLAIISEQPAEVEERKLRDRKIKQRKLQEQESPDSLYQHILLILGRKEDPEAKSRARDAFAQREIALRAQPLRDPLYLTSVLRYISVLLATCFSPRDRVVVHEQFVELLQHWQSSISIMTDKREHLDRVFGRYGGDCENLKRIVDHLARAVWLFRFRWTFMVAGGLVSVAVCLQSCGV